MPARPPSEPTAAPAAHRLVASLDFMRTAAVPTAMSRATKIVVGTVGAAAVLSVLVIVALALG